MGTDLPMLFGDVTTTKTYMFKIIIKGTNGYSDSVVETNLNLTVNPDSSKEIITSAKYNQSTNQLTIMGGFVIGTNYIVSIPNGLSGNDTVTETGKITQQYNDIASGSKVTVQKVSNVNASGNTASFSVSAKQSPEADIEITEDNVVPAVSNVKFDIGNRNGILKLEWDNPSNQDNIQDCIFFISADDGNTWFTDLGNLKGLTGTYIPMLLSERTGTETYVFKITNKGMNGYSDSVVQPNIVLTVTEDSTPIDISSAAFNQTTKVLEILGTFEVGAAYDYQIISTGYGRGGTISVTETGKISDSLASEFTMPSNPKVIVRKISNTAITGNDASFTITAKQAEPVDITIKN